MITSINEWRKVYENMTELDKLLNGITIQLQQEFKKELTSDRKLPEFVDLEDYVKKYLQDEGYDVELYHEQLYNKVLNLFDEPELAKDTIDKNMDTKL